MGIDAGDEKNMTADELDLARWRNNAHASRVPCARSLDVIREARLPEVHARGVYIQSLYTHVVSTVESLMGE